MGKGLRGDLRYCINKVNAEPGPDVIDFAVTGIINLTGVLPDLSSDTDIQGPGPALLAVRRDTGGEYGIFTVTTGVHAEISGLWIANGDRTLGSGVHNAGTLLIQDCVVINGLGSGIYNDATGVLAIHNSVVSNNATGGATIPSTVRGAGIYNQKGRVDVSFSTISGNTAFGHVTEGGGIYSDGTLTIDSSTISGNAAISKATVYAFALPRGGGLYNAGAVAIRNSTIADNQTDQTIDELYSGVSGGAGIYHESGSLLMMSNSTIAGNTALSNYSSARGGGIHNSGLDNQVTSLRNTIVAGNSANTGSDFSGKLTSSTFNVFGNSAGGAGYDDSDLLDVDPMLGPLADNGGPTLTMALLPGSPAIDAGDNTDAPEFDQRGPGFPRIVNGTIDIGAFEVQASPVTPLTHRPDFLALVLATADLDSLT